MEGLEVRKTFDWYKHKDKYKNTVINEVDSLIDKNNRKTFCLNSSEFKESLVNIFTNLDRVLDRYEERKSELGEEALIRLNDDYTIIIKKIEEDFINQFKGRKYKVKGSDGDIEFIKK